MTARRRNNRPGWEYVFDLEPGPDGKRRQRRRAGFKTKKEAEQAEREERAAIDKGIVISDERLTTGTYLQQWLAHKKASGIAYMTYTGYEYHTRAHLVPALGAIELTKLRPLQIQAAYRRITDAGLSVSTVRHAHTVLSMALAQAVHWQLLSRNPAAAADVPKPPLKVVTVPTRPELTRLLAEGDKTPYGVLYRVMALSGVRRGESLGLHWDNVYLDAEPPHIVVREAAQRQVGKGIVMKAPKRQDSARTVVLLPETVELLRQHRLRQAEEKARESLDYQDQGLVFGNPLGLPIDAGTLRNTWLKVVQRAGTGRVTLHQLRHTHATQLLQAGVHPKIVQERLGHRSIEITMNLYSHVTPSMQEEAVGRLERFLEE